MSNKQCAYWNLVINPSAKCYASVGDTLKGLLLNNPNLEYCYIYHHCDDDSDNDAHIHLVLYFKGTVKRFDTLFKIFDGAHIEQTNAQRYLRCIQYLIHKNNPEKEQYKVKDIITNLSHDRLNEIFISDGYEFELFQEEKLYDYLNEEYVKGQGHLSMDSFILRFGLSGISKYYFIIKDVMKEYLATLYKSSGRKLDDSDRAWMIYSQNLRIEFKQARFNGWISNSMSFEDFEREQYQVFLQDIEKGFINIKDILKGDL